MNGNIFNIQHFSLHDGPGIRTTVFMQGCPLDCIWCHNIESKPYGFSLFYNDAKCTFCKNCESVCEKQCHIFENGIHKINRNLCVLCGKCEDVCDFDALRLSGKNIGVAEVIKEIEKDAVFFGDDGGVTFSGGEPFAQYEFLLSLLKASKEKEYNTCVETCGYVNSEKLKESAKYIDLFLFDFKESNPDLHKEFTGKDNALILKNLELLNEIGATVILRCPIIPNCNNRNDHFENIGKLAERLYCIKGVELMPYHPLGISKAAQLDIIPKYNNSNFLDDALLTQYIDEIKKHTKKSVTSSK